MVQTTVLILAGCLALSTLFGALHSGLNDLSRSALEALAARKRARRSKLAGIARINADVEAHARSIALVRIICTLAMGVIAASLVSQVRGSPRMGWPDGLIAVAGTGLLVWLCGIVVAESLSRHAGERLVYHFSSLIRAAYVVQRPFAPISGVVDATVRAVMGVKERNKGEEIEQELLDVVEESEREGQIDEREREMIEAVVGFKDRTVEQIMTPRNEIEALPLTGNLGTITAFVRKARHSRVPVYKNSLDEIVGFFYVKDLLQWLAGGGTRVSGPTPSGGNAGGFDLRAILRPAMLVPESKTIRALAEEFVEKKVHVAVVVDEYGGTAGIVSLEDIIEEVFGDIQDEYEQAADDPPRIEVRANERGDGGVAEIDGRAYIADVNAALEQLRVEVPESDEYDTLGGFVLSTLGRMPAQNESFTFGGPRVNSAGIGGDPGGHSAGGPRMVVTVLQSTPMKVVRVRILVPSEHHEAAAAEPPVSEANPA